MADANKVQIEILVSTGKAKQELNKFKESLGGIGSKGSKDVGELAKSARRFSREWGVSFKDAYDYQKKLGLGMEQTKEKVKKSAEDISYQLTFIAWHFRYLGSVVGKFGDQMLKTVKDVIKVSAELQESFLSIKIAAVLYGESVDKAIGFTKELALSGLIPLTEAAGSVKNLMITGLGLPEMEKFSYRYLDVAFLFTSGMDEMQKSLEVISESILRGTMVLSADVTAKTLWVQTDKRLQATMGKTLTDLSARQKALEILKTIEDKYAATLDLHKIEMETTRASMNKLTTSITLIKEAFGTALVPILNAVSNALATVSLYIQGLITVLGPVVPAAVAAALATAFFLSKISFAIGVFISLQNIVRGLSAMAGVTALSLWKIYLPMLAISAVVLAGTYLYLRYSGALDKTKQSVASINAQLKGLADTYKGVMANQEESMVVDEDKRIQHQRNVEDIMEDINREKNKGLWANQITIQDLEKKLKRENEDWAKTVKGKGDASEEGNKGLLGDMADTFKEIEDATKTHSDVIKKLWNIMGVDSWNEFKKALVDPTVWKFLIDSITNNVKNLMLAVGNAFWELPPIVHAVFASLLTYLLITTIPGIIKAFTGLTLSLTGSFASIKAAFLILGATLSAPIAVTILVFAAVLALSAILQKFKEVKGAMTDQQKTIQESGDFWSAYIKKQGVYLKEGKINVEQYNDAYKMAMESMSQLNSTLIDPNPYPGGPPPFISGENSLWAGFKKLIGFQHGGIVPGMTNQPSLAIVHGGERVIPAGESAGSGMVTININNPIVRENEDINRIAKAVSQVLGRKMQLAQIAA